MVGQGWPSATRCEQCEDGKVYVERVQGSEWGFEHLTEGEDMVVSQDGHAFHCFASHCSSLLYSSISLQTLQGSGCIMALCLHLCFCSSLTALFITPSHHNFLPFWYREKWHHKHCYSVGNDKCTQVFVNKTFNCILIWDECLRTSHTFNCIL